MTAWLKQHVTRLEVVLISVVVIVVCLAVIAWTRPTPTDEALQMMREVEDRISDSEKKIGQHVERFEAALERFKNLLVTQNIHQQFNIGAGAEELRDGRVRDILVRRNQIGDQ